jgi:hypothetical protein
MRDADLLPTPQYTLRLQPERSAILQPPGPPGLFFESHHNTKRTDVVFHN